MMYVGLCGLDREMQGPVLLYGSAVLRCRCASVVSYS